MNNIDIHNFIDGEEIVSLLQEMIKIKTVNEPGDEKGLAEFISRELNSAGIESWVSEISEYRANVIGRIKGKDERKSLLLNGHLDTVPTGDIKWEYDPFGGIRVGDKIYGRGSADMKGGLAAMIASLKAIKRSGVDLKGDLIFAGTAGEETDSIGAIKFVQDGGLEGVGAIIIGEPSSNGITIAEKGAFWLEITTYGKVAHGAFPDQGINAIAHMNAFISELINLEFEYEYSSILGNPSKNISTIIGGVKTNVVPDKCSITVDIRTLPGMKHEDILDSINGLIKKLESEIEGFKADIKILNDRAAVQTKPEHPFIKLSIETARKVFNRDLKPNGVNFYTDASIFLLDKEIPCVIYGPGDANMAHQPNEYVLTDSLLDAAYFYTAIINEYLVV